MFFNHIIFWGSVFLVKTNNGWKNATPFYLEPMKLFGAVSETGIPENAYGNSFQLVYLETQMLPTANNRR